MERIIKRVNPVEIQRAPRAKRVAAYARVSCGKDAMLHSLSAQVSYYSALIQKTPGWEYAGVYADEAISGTKNNRGEFQKMLDDCRNGKIDLIIAGAGGKPVYIGECEVGAEEAVCGRKGEPAVQAVFRLPEGQG